MNLDTYIREIPNFPKTGILFKDITPLLGDAEAFRSAIDCLYEYYVTKDVDAIAGIDARGFLVAGPLAYLLHKPLIPIRKLGKLPGSTNKESYSLEYGSNTMEIHTDSMSRGQKILIVDDLLATGGTITAAIKLVEKTGGEVMGIGVLIELSEIQGRRNLIGYDVHALAAM